MGNIEYEDIPEYGKEDYIRAYEALLKYLGDARNELDTLIDVMEFDLNDLSYKDKLESEDIDTATDLTQKIDSHRLAAKYLSEMCDTFEQCRTEFTGEHNGIIDEEIPF